MASYWWWLAAAPLGVVVVGLLLTRPRKTLAGDMTEPMDLERGRAKSEAAMTAPLSDADAEAAAPLVAYVEKIGTGEQPIVYPVRRHHAYRRPARWQRVAIRRQSLRGFVADPLAAAIPGRHRVEEPVLWGAAVEDWFLSPPVLEPVSLAFPELPAEPEPGPALDFTGSWNGEARRELAALLAAGAEAGAR